MKRIETGLLSLALAVPLAAGAQEWECVAEKAGQEKPNVVLIYADDLGLGDLECYGAKGVKTPNVNN